MNFLATTKSTFLALGVVGLVLGCHQASPDRAVRETSSNLGRELVLGDIEPDEPVRRIRRFAPLARKLEELLEPHGITRVRVVIARDVTEMAEFLSRGEVDLFFDSVYPTVAVQELAASRIVLSRVVLGQTESHSVFLGRADRDYGDAQDLQGSVIAFQDRHSTSGYLLPAMYLCESGHHLLPVSDPTQPVPAGATGIYFSRDEENVIELVRAGVVAAGVLSSEHWAQLPVALEPALRDIAQTQAVPRQLVSLGAHVDPALSEVIVGTLLALTDADRREMESAYEGRPWTWEFVDLGAEQKQDLVDFRRRLEMLMEHEKAMFAQ